MATIHSYFLELPESLKEGDTFQVVKKNYSEWFHQFTKVLRSKEGTELYVLDNKGNRALCAVNSIQKESISLKVESTSLAEKHKYLYLWLPLTSQKKVELIIQMATQLGVSGFRFFESEYSSEEHWIANSNKQERLRKIAQEAAEQSEQYFIPSVNFNIVELNAIPREIPTYVAVERSDLPEEQDTKEILNMQLVIGPEGGFSPKEKELFIDDSQFIPVGLGIESILRLETAAVVGCYSLLRT